MIRIFVVTLVALNVATVGNAQDTGTNPPTPAPATQPTPPPPNGALLGGTLTPGVAAGLAIVGIAVTLGAGGGTGTTTTTTTP